MEITEVRIKLMDDPSERLRAFCSVTFDHSFVVRDLKIIEGSSGPFVAMPSRKLTSHCSHCGSKNHLRAVYCNQCGNRVPRDASNRSEDGRAKLYADIAHPINSLCREVIQKRVVEAYHEELEKAKQPDYVSKYDDYDDDLDIEGVSPPPPHSRGEQDSHKPVHSPETMHGTHHNSHEQLAPPSDGFGAGIF